ncbi:GNAT family N-acetyltransferase [Nocardioides alkalitolerans]|uniref:GNAT family N-acetyltransferase n=1 Tax=Nocardioides alkalitolerans TaxID=281714 RepID=UPI0012F8BDF0|nr:GNAT family N-acetyltransferase [Nocardioides alkalitolerans]
MTTTEAADCHVVPLDVHDDAALRAWWELEHASLTERDTEAPHRTYDALVATARTPSEYHGLQLLAAYDADPAAGGALVGTAELSWPLEGNDHVVEAEIHVHPARRRAGFGRIVWAEVLRRTAELGRTTVTGELTVGAGEESPAGLAFAGAVGLRTVHVEDHLVLALPVPEGHADRLLTLTETAAAGYEVVSWVDACPDELVEAYCRLRTQMGEDVPRGESAVAPTPMTVERLRASEERLRASYVALVAAVRRTSDGEMAGYSSVLLDRTDDIAYQGDTLVMPDHRGHKLGTLLKLTTLEMIADDHPERRLLHTWVASTNAPMQAVNRAFGFVPVDQAHMVEATLGA